MVNKYGIIVHDNEDNHLAMLITFIIVWVFCVESHILAHFSTDLLPI